MTEGGHTEGHFLERIYTFRAKDQAVHGTHRLASFTDAILAIAATVLVLDLTVRVDTSSNGLVHQINMQRYQLASVLLGFVWITGQWLLSHRTLRQLRGVDHYMTLLVIAAALDITLIPFATLLLAEGYGHADFWVGVLAVSLVLLVGNVLSALSSWYSHDHDLMIAESAPAGRRTALRIWVFFIAVVLVAVVVARWAPWVALTLVILERISALMPLGSDRAGVAGDLGRRPPAGG
jgi:uncharacterized membrane protein